MPLRLMMGVRAFAKWGINYIIPIDQQTTRIQAQYIIAATHYVTKWVHVKATQKNDTHTPAKFLFENVFTQYGLPIEIASDRGLHFLKKVICNLLNMFIVSHKKMAPYHLQANDQTKSTNKILKMVLIYKGCE